MEINPDGIGDITTLDLIEVDKQKDTRGTTGLWK